MVGERDVGFQDAAVSSPKIIRPVKSLDGKSDRRICVYCLQPLGTNPYCPHCTAYQIQLASHGSLFRIVTELKNKDDVERIVSSEFDGFCMIWGRGLYLRNGEPSLIVEIVTHEGQKVLQTAGIIKLFNEQEEVIVQKVPIVVWRI